MPIGRTPGCLSSAISQQATKADIPFGSTYCVFTFLAMEAIAVHKPAEAVLKELHNRFQAAALRPDGPAAPSIFRAIL